MSLIDILPLIRGWTWKQEIRTGTVLLNQELLLYQPTPAKEIGWLCGLDFVGNDAFLGLRMVAPGVDSGYMTFAAAQAIGAFLPPPSGSYLGLFNQPNPLRTIGQYAASWLTSAYPWPFFGPGRIYISLRPGSTEAFATGIATITSIVIEDRNLFLTDLRKVKYGRLAPLMDLIGHIPILKILVKKFEDLRIPFEEKEIIEPPGVAR